MPITNLTRQTTLANRAEMANTPLARMKGLLGKDRMPGDYGLVITGCQSIHMLFMKFAIDVVFIDDKNNVVGLTENIQPFSLSPVFWKASSAIELSVGTIKKSNTAIGDQITIS
jgi:uncharacterized protein